MYRKVKLIFYLFCIIHQIASELDHALQTTQYVKLTNQSSCIWDTRYSFRYAKPGALRILDNPIVGVVHNTLRATARSCMAHVNATESDLESLRKDPPFPEKSACIVTCLLEKIGIVEKDNYSKTGFMTIVSPLVFRNKKKLEHMKTLSENCDKEINRGVSPCQLGNEITICIFKYAPELHFKS